MFDQLKVKYTVSVFCLFALKFGLKHTNYALRCLNWKIERIVQTFRFAAAISEAAKIYVYPPTLASSMTIF